MTAGPTRATVQAPLPVRATAVPGQVMTAGPTTAGPPGRVTRVRTRVTPRTITRGGATGTRATRSSSVTRTSATPSRLTRSRLTRSRAPARSRGTRNTVTRVRAARDSRATEVTPDPGYADHLPIRVTQISAIRRRATRRPTPRLTRTRDTASTGTPSRTTRPRATPSPTRTRGTAPSATAGRTRPIAARVDSTRINTRIRTRKPPRASRPSRRSPMKQIRPRSGNRGGGAGVTRYQPVWLCPRAAPTAFAEYRSAGAVLRLSPRGDLRTGQRDEGLWLASRPFVPSGPRRLDKPGTQSTGDQAPMAWSPALTRSGRLLDERRAQGEPELGAHAGRYACC